MDPQLQEDLELQRALVVPFYLNRASIHTAQFAANIHNLEKKKRKTIDSSETTFKPRKLKKQADSKYRDRAAERRVGEGNDYAHVHRCYTATRHSRLYSWFIRLKLFMKNSKRKLRVAKTKRRQVLFNIHVSKKKVR